MINWILSGIFGWLLSLPQQFLAAYGLPGVIVVAAAGVLAFKVMQKTKKPLMAATVMGVMAMAALWFLPGRSGALAATAGRPGPGTKRKAATPKRRDLPKRTPATGAMPLAFGGAPGTGLGGSPAGGMRLGTGASPGAFSGSAGSAKVAGPAVGHAIASREESFPPAAPEDASYPGGEQGDSNSQAAGGSGPAGSAPVPTASNAGSNPSQGNASAAKKQASPDAQSRGNNAAATKAAKSGDNPSRGDSPAARKQDSPGAQSKDNRASIPTASNTGGNQPQSHSPVTGKRDPQDAQTRGNSTPAAKAAKPGGQTRLAARSSHGTADGRSGHGSVTGNPNPGSPPKISRHTSASNQSGHSGTRTAQVKPLVRKRIGASKGSVRTVPHRSAPRVSRLPLRRPVNPPRQRMMPMMPRGGGMGGHFGGGHHGGFR